MTQHHPVRQRLHALEALMREHQYWEAEAPDSAAFASTQRPPSSTPWDLALALFLESYICFVVLRTLRRSFAKLPF